MEKLIRWQKEQDREIERLAATAENQIYVPWTDYSSTVTLTGWSGTPTAETYYTQSGYRVFVAFTVTGTSNATNCRVSLPVTAMATGLSTIRFTCEVQDNGTWAVGVGRVDTALNTVIRFQPAVGASLTGWTASGTKTVIGSGWYIAAA